MRQHIERIISEWLARSGFRVVVTLEWVDGHTYVGSLDVTQDMLARDSEVEIHTVKLDGILPPSNIPQYQQD